MLILILTVTFVLLFLLVFLSAVEGAASNPSRLALKVLAEKHTGSGYRLLEKVSIDRPAFLLPVQVGSQLLLVAVSMLVTYLFVSSGLNYPLLYSAFSLVAVVCVFRQWIPNLWVGRDSEEALLRLLRIFRRSYGLLCWITLPVTAPLTILLRGLSEELVEEDEATEEEIQAYLGVGEEEGIFESTESRLIQSALEFGSTLVREIMTPRNEIVAIEQSSTLQELKDLIVSKKHSRIPVFQDQIDHVVGMVYVRALLSRLEAGSEQSPITPLINDVLIVPDTKKVDELLKEMQAKAEQMAIVVNEYGTVSGLVTVEDLLEEIVGDIRDEDEFRRVDLAYEGSGNYIVRGGLEVEDLEEAIGVDYGEHDAATVSGLVVDHLGKVPSSGETVILDGTQIEVLSSDRRRIHTMRVSLAADSKAPLEDNPD